MTGSGMEPSKGSQRGGPCYQPFWLCRHRSRPLLERPCRALRVVIVPEHARGSSIDEGGSKPFPVIEFGTFDKASARKYLEDYAGPQDIPEGDLNYLVWRRRFAARVVLDWAQSGQVSILKCL